MRISDWSSDVCSSDLLLGLEEKGDQHHVRRQVLLALLLEAEEVVQQAVGEIVEIGEARVQIGVLDGSHARTGLVLDLLHRRLGRQAAAHLVVHRSEEHTSELQSLMRISYAVFCLIILNIYLVILSLTTRPCL